MSWKGPMVGGKTHHALEHAMRAAAQRDSDSDLRRKVNGQRGPTEEALYAFLLGLGERRYEVCSRAEWRRLQARRPTSAPSLAAE